MIERTEDMGKEEFQKLLLEKLNSIDSQVKENTAILKALEHKAEVNKAEHDQMAMDIAKISGNVVSVMENNKSIFELIGEHDVSIRTLKRKPV